MKIIDEFKQFAARGNVIDLAVGIIIGSAFGKIVSSLVEDVIMPPIGILIGGVNFSDLKIVLKNENGAVVALNYGNFVQTAVNFLIIAFSVFLMIKGINILKRLKKKPVESKKTTNEEKLLTEIRDLLKK